MTFPLDTTALADGCHELTAVVYEGSHVRTQARVTQNVRIQNTPLSATFTTLAGAANTVLNFTLLFSVAANTNTISTIELFTTGGSVGVVSNLSSATFAVAATNLGVGLHPFYAVVTRSDGKQYRTGDEVDSHRRVGTAVWADADRAAAGHRLAGHGRAALRSAERDEHHRHIPIARRRSRRQIPPDFGLTPSRARRNNFIVFAHRLTAVFKTLESHVRTMHR